MYRLKLLSENLHHFPTWFITLVQKKAVTGKYQVQIINHSNNLLIVAIAVFGGGIPTIRRRKYRPRYDDDSQLYRSAISFADSYRDVSNDLIYIII